MLRFEVGSLQAEAIAGNPQALLAWRAWARRSIGVPALTIGE